MKITIEGTEIEINGNDLSFLDESTGLQRTVVPIALNYNIETGSLAVQAVARDKSPTGVVVREINLGNLALEFEFVEFKEPDFQNKYLNGLFRSIMARFGLGAHQVISEETGEVEVIKDAPVIPEYPSWIQPTGAHDAYPKDSKVLHNGKVWESTVDANVWEPGVSGWKEVV